MALSKEMTTAEETRNDEAGHVYGRSLKMPGGEHVHSESVAAAVDDSQISGSAGRHTLLSPPGLEVHPGFLCSPAILGRACATFQHNSQWTTRVSLLALFPVLGRSQT